MSERNMEPTSREAFILEKAKQFTPTEIVVLLEREGFKPLTIGRIYQILERHGIEPKRNRVAVGFKKVARAGKTA